MSKEIDLTQPLSDEDRAYLLERGKENEVRAHDERHGVDADPRFMAGDGSGPQVRQVLASQVAGSERDRLIERLRELDADAAAQFDSVESPEPGDDDLPYEQWPKADLVQEVEARNEGRDAGSKLVKTGTVAELAARLREDDASA